MFPASCFAQFDFSLYFSFLFSCLSIVLISLKSKQCVVCWRVSVLTVLSLAIYIVINWLKKFFNCGRPSCKQGEGLAFPCAIFYLFIFVIMFHYYAFLCFSPFFLMPSVCFLNRYWSRITDSCLINMPDFQLLTLTVKYHAYFTYDCRVRNSLRGNFCSKCISWKEHATCSAKIHS